MWRLNGWRWISRISVLDVVPPTVSSMTVLAAEIWLSSLSISRVLIDERLRLAAVAVDDGGNRAGLAKLARDAGAAFGAGRGVQ